MSQKYELNILLNIYIQTKSHITDSENMCYEVCELINGELNKWKNCLFYLQSGEMNEDVDNELKILATFSIECEEHLNSEQISNTVDVFLEKLPTDLSCINEAILNSDELNVQIHQSEINTI